MTDILHKIGSYSYKNLEEISGITTASVINFSVFTFAITALQSVILALLTGAAGAAGAHLIKKYILKSKPNETNQ